MSPGVGLVGSGSVQVEVGGFELTKHLAVAVDVESHWAQWFVGMVLAAPELTTPCVETSFLVGVQSTKVRDF